MVIPLSHRTKIKKNYLNGGQGWNRTTDTRIFSPLLYQLSYLAFERNHKRERDYKSPAEFRQARDIPTAQESGQIERVRLEFFDRNKLERTDVGP